VTGMRSANSRIKRNCKGEGRGESVPSSFALSTAASTCSAAAAQKRCVCHSLCATALK
jgi:hypothetical protein